MNATSSPVPTLPRNILVAVDAGPLSDHAIRVALDLARRFDARIELVHAFGSPVLSWSLVPDKRAVGTRAEELNRARECVVAHVGALFTAEHGGRLRADDILRVVPGRPAKVVLDRAREISADLIVLGTLRRRPAIDFGSTARAVLGKSACPVWVQPGPFREIHRILVPVDLSDESLLALATACEMAPRFRATVSALHVFEVSSLAAVPWDGYVMLTDVEAIRNASLEVFEKAMKDFDWRGVEHDACFTSGSAADEILEQARASDLIVMGTHGRTGFSSVLLGSVAYQVLKLTQRPVMVVRKPGRKFET
jgi:nucleotide-binding universal stress UspA family protein